MSKPISQLNMFSPKEYQAIIHGFNDTALAFPREKCAHTLFEEQVEKTPEKTAVIACDRELTYGELNEQSNIIAHNLIHAGIQPGDIVTLVLSRNSRLLCAMLGVLKAGAAYMPIVTDYPQERIDYMVQDCGAKLVLTDENILQYTTGNYTKNPQVAGVTPQSAFCVLHTSGSTGTPKCAALKHINMTNFAYSNEELLQGIDYVIAINAVTFDVFEMDTIFALLFGNTCVLANETQQFVQTEFEAMMAKYQNCLFWATPTKMQNYIDNSPTKAFVKNINCYIVGGEVVTEQFIQKVASCNEKLAIYTVYGPTETLIYSTMQQLKAPDGSRISGGVDVLSKPIYQLNMLSPEERRQVLCDFNETQIPYGNKCIPKMFQELVVKEPHKFAVMACDATLTYGELNAEANRIAHGLIAKGVRPGDIVAFILPRKSFLLAAMLGILKSGAAYLPIDPDYPQNRIDFLLADSGAKFCITEDTIGKLLANGNKADPDILIHADSCYCALHTSGSTGKPKLSALSHGNLINFLQGSARFFENVAVTVSATIVTFDAFILDTVVSLCMGVPVKLLGNDEIYNQELFEKAFSNVQNALFFSTPTKLKHYIESSETKAFTRSIAAFVVGGELFGEELYHLIRKYNNNARIFNIYGPTETTICASFQEIKETEI